MILKVYLFWSNVNQTDYGPYNSICFKGNIKLMEGQNTYLQNQENFWQQLVLQLSEDF